MIKFETIKKILKEYGYIPNLEAYTYENQSGLLINFDKLDTTDISVCRLIIFKSEDELRKFLTIYKYMITHKDSVKFRLDNLDSFIPEGYIFTKDGKEYSYNDAVHDINEENTYIKKIKQDYINQREQDYLFIQNKIEYFRFINDLDIDKLENIVTNLKNDIFKMHSKSKKIDTSIIDNYKFIPNNTKKITFDLSDIEILEDNMPWLNEYQKYDERNSFQNEFRRYVLTPALFESNSFRQYIENEEKYKKSQMYIEIIEYLQSLKKSSIINKIFTRNKIKANLEKIRNKYHFLSEEEKNEHTENLNKLYSYFLKKQSEVSKKTYKRFYIENILFIKLCMDVSYEEGKKNIDTYCENLIKKGSEMSKEKDNKDKKDNKEKDIYLDLIQQFEKKGLPEEQKMALLAYNSALFLIINVITSIPNYDKMTEDEIKNVLSDRFREVLELNELYYPKNIDTTTYYFAVQLRQGYQYEKEGFGKYIKDIVFNKHYIGKILDVIKILNNIRTNIILPEDVTVYRCISTNNPSSNPAMGKFLSTSLSFEKAKSYYQIIDNKNPVMYKIKIKKGTPLTAIFPQKIVSSAFGKHLVDDLTSDEPVMEIMLNMEDYEIEPKSIKQYKISNYTKQHNELYKLKDYIVYEITIVPKKKYLQKIEKENNDDSLISNKKR